MKRIVILLLALCLLTGCAAPAAQPETPATDRSLRAGPQTGVAIPEGLMETPERQAGNDRNPEPLQAEPQTAANPEGMMESSARQDGDCHTSDIGHWFAMTGSDDGDCRPRNDPGDDTEPAVPACTFSISCGVLTENPETLAPEKAALVPADGWLLPPSEVALEPEESVFDLLLRLCREKGIHLEFSQTPVYGSAYIEGIGNLYEFDAGALSGWMYRVNGTFPHTGCSQVFPADGDRVEWLYTLDLGQSEGGELS